MKTLIVFGTRYGATATTSVEIAKALQAEGFDVKVLNAKEEKIEDISPHNLIIVGGGMQDCMSCGTGEKFVDGLKNLQINRGNGNQDFITDLLL